MPNGSHRDAEDTIPRGVEDITVQRIEEAEQIYASVKEQLAYVSAQAVSVELESDNQADGEEGPIQDVSVDETQGQ